MTTPNSVKKIAKELESSTWNIADAAKAWRVPRRTASEWFEKGHVKGAEKIDGRWRCPAGTKRPDVPPRGRPKARKKKVVVRRGRR